MKVIKRDGREVEFNKSKISNAIGLAMKRCNVENIDLCNKIANEIENLHKDLNVEDIQDMIENKITDLLLDKDYENNYKFNFDEIVK